MLLPPTVLDLAVWEIVDGRSKSPVVTPILGTCMDKGRSCTTCWRTKTRSEEFENSAGGSGEEKEKGQAVQMHRAENQVVVVMETFKEAQQ